MAASAYDVNDSTTWSNSDGLRAIFVKFKAHRFLRAFHRAGGGGLGRGRAQAVKFMPVANTISYGMCSKIFSPSDDAPSSMLLK